MPFSVDYSDCPKSSNSLFADWKVNTLRYQLIVCSNTSASVLERNKRCSSNKNNYCWDIKIYSQNVCYIPLSPFCLLVTFLSTLLHIFIHRVLTSTECVAVFHILSIETTFIHGFLYTRFSTLGASDAAMTKTVYIKIEETENKAENKWEFHFALRTMEKKTRQQGRQSKGEHLLYTDGPGRPLWGVLSEQRLEEAVGAEVSHQERHVPVLRKTQI